MAKIGCGWEEILLVSKTTKPRNNKETGNGDPVSHLEEFKMAVVRVRAKLNRLLPYFLGNKDYCVSANTKPYVYHPQSRTLEPENQTLYLTKTLEMGDISTCLQSSHLDLSTREDMMSKFRQNVIQTRLVNHEGDHATRDMNALPLMQNMLRVTWSYSGRWESIWYRHMFTLILQSTRPLTCICVSLNNKRQYRVFTSFF